jgi:beclin 1
VRDPQESSETAVQSNLEERYRETIEHLFHPEPQAVDRQLEEVSLPLPLPPSPSSLTLPQLERERDDLLREVAACDAEMEEVSERRAQLLREEQRWRAVESATLQQVDGARKALDAVAESAESASLHASHAIQTLQTLLRYNSYNDAFHIWHEGSFATINGLRLGRLATATVEWTEINAALGQTAMLLVILSQRAGFSFGGKSVVSRGSFSRVLNASGRSFNLFFDGSFLRRRSFGHALALLLECVDEASEAVRATDESLVLPYKITRGKIGDLTVVPYDEEQWTRAMKFLLTHLKWILLWVTKTHPLTA